MNIDGREITSDLPPYIVAEISCNHGGSFERANKLVIAAKECGVDAVKLQCYTPDEITLNCDSEDFVIKSGPWSGRKLHELYTRTHTPREWFAPLFELAKSLDITIFASVFSPDGVEFLEELGCCCYKIPSFEIVDTPLIRKAAATGKPLIISTGMASDKEIHEAVLAAGQNHALLHCVSGYPTEDGESNLHGFITLNNQWGNVGISDHSRHFAYETSLAATALGATIIERHFMIDGNPEDAPFSLIPDQMSSLVKRTHNIWKSLQPSERKAEQPSRQLRRSLYAVVDIKSGEQFTEKNIRSIRPAYGLPSSELDTVLLRRSHRNIKAGTALQSVHVYGV